MIFGNLCQFEGVNRCIGVGDGSWDVWTMMVFLEDETKVGDFLIICNNQMLWNQNSEKSNQNNQKVYNFQNMSCRASKVQRIEKLETKGQQFQSIINCPSQCQDNVITKHFQLQLPNYLITIQDTFQIDFNCLKMPAQDQLNSKIKCKNAQFQGLDKSEPNKKLVLFRSNMRGAGGHGKGDKKNIAKNVVTAFINFVKDQKQENSQTQQQLQILKNLTLRNKYNNQLISELINCQQLRDNFKQFLSGPALTWIHHSKLKNKEIHEEAITLYERLIDEKEGEAQRVNERKVEVQIENDENEYYFQSGINHDLQQQIENFK